MRWFSSLIPYEVRDYGSDWTGRPLTFVRKNACWCRSGSMTLERCDCHNGKATSNPDGESARCVKCGMVFYGGATDNGDGTMTIDPETSSKFVTRAQMPCWPSRNSKAEMFSDQWFLDVEANDCCGAKRIERVSAEIRESDHTYVTLLRCKSCGRETRNVHQSTVTTHTTVWQPERRQLPAPG